MKTARLLALAFPALLASSAFPAALPRVEASAEALVSDDISIAQARLDHTAAWGAWALDLGVGVTSYDLDYASSLFGTARHLDTDTFQTGLALTRDWDDAVSSTANLSLYEGFADFRSLWISEHYHEQFGAFVGDYRKPDPHGVSLGLSGAWQYQPGAGRVETGLTWGRDTLAPGWQFNPFAGKPEPSRDTLDTVATHLRIEQALNGWLKTEAALSYRDTTGREPRWGLSHSWAASAGPLALRLGGGYSEERPSFRASHAGVTLEWNFLPDWHATLGHRLYRDTGEIENSSFSAAAPRLRSQETSLGLLWERNSLSVSAGVGLLQSDYGDLSPATNFFSNLYRDRNWTTFRVAAALEF